MKERFLLDCGKFAETVIQTRPGEQLTYVLFLAGEHEKDLEVNLVGGGSEVTLLGFFFGKASDALSLRVTLRHAVPNTKAIANLRGIVSDRATADVRGLIKIEPAGQQTDSSLEAHALILSDEARARTDPMLEIEADDVKASHGATVGKIDPEQLFYLQTRGIPGEHARRHIVEAFFAPLIAKVRDEQLSQRVKVMVAEGLRGEIGLWHL